MQRPIAAQTLIHRPSWPGIGTGGAGSPSASPTITGSCPMQTLSQMSPEHRAAFEALQERHRGRIAERFEPPDADANGRIAPPPYRLRWLVGEGRL